MFHTFAYNFIDMEQDVFISIKLDMRRMKTNGLYPVKLRVYSNRLKKQKLYPTKFEFSEKEFDSIWNTKKTRSEFIQDKLKLAAVESGAWNVANQLSVFSFEAFEKKSQRQKGDGENVFYHYAQIINRLEQNGQLGTKSNYELSLKSIHNFLARNSGKAPSRLIFSEITAAWLNSYENYMVNVLKRSRTTVSIYLRALRTVFNTAIAEKDISAENYPFGKRQYQVPAVKKVKKALNQVDLKTLYLAQPKNHFQKKAKDFWFFSYNNNGMNAKDIALLKYRDLVDDRIVFYRAKTINTSKSNLTPVVIYLTEFSASIIDMYGNIDKTPNNYVFPIINDGMSNLEKHTSIKKFTRFINQHVKKIAVDSGVKAEISLNWARHSFATKAIRSGLTMEFVSEALSHSNLKTTQGYFAGFEDVAKREFGNTLMNF